jgi:hypothetical protein
MNNPNTAGSNAGAAAASAPANAPTIVPTIGRIVLYRLASYDVVAIHKQRGLNHSSNEISEGQVFPAIVVQTWGTTPTSSVNLKVMLDGSDTHWVRSSSVGVNNGQYHWMQYQVGQAAKAEAAEAKLKEATAAA